MRNIKKINKIIKQHGSSQHAPGADDAPPAAAIGMGHLYDGALEKAARKRRLQAEAEARARRMETQLHAAIGLVFDNAAAIKQLELVDVLGLADALKELLAKPDFRSDIRLRGQRLYSEQYVRAVALTIIGAPPAPDMAAALRNAGFVRAGQLWSGKANIPEAVRLATSHGLSLMRYDADDAPVYFVRKGEKQPELAMLEAEHEQMLLSAGASLPPTAVEADEGGQVIAEAFDGGDKGEAGNAQKAEPETAKATIAKSGAAVTGSGFGRIRTSGRAGPRPEEK